MLRHKKGHHKVKVGEERGETEEAEEEAAEEEVADGEEEAVDEA